MTRQNLMLNLRDARSVPDLNSSAAAPLGTQVKQAVLDCHSRSKYCLVDRCCTSPPTPLVVNWRNVGFFPVCPQSWRCWRFTAAVGEVLKHRCCCCTWANMTAKWHISAQHPPHPPPRPPSPLLCLCLSVMLSYSGGLFCFSFCSFSLQTSVTVFLQVFIWISCQTVLRQGFHMSWKTWKMNSQLL